MKTRLIKFSFLFIAVAAIVSAFAFADFKRDPDTAVSAAGNAEKGIVFIEQDWNKALEQAKAGNKLVFLDIYATWCGPCKMLKKNTFSNEEAGKFFNENFINVSVDGEAGAGPDLARKFAIQGYPSLIITDASGNIVLQTAGYVDKDYLINFAKEALKRKL